MTASDVHNKILLCLLLLRNDKRLRSRALGRTGRPRARAAVGEADRRKESADAECMEAVDGNFRLKAVCRRFEALCG